MENFNFDDLKKKMMNIGDSLTRIEMPGRGKGDGDEKMRCSYN